MVGLGYGVVDLGCASTLGADGQFTGFLGAFRPTGACEWVYGRDGAEFFGVASGADGVVYVAGRHHVAVDFGGGERSAPATFNGVILALDPAGAYSWDRVFSSPAYAGIAAIGARSDGVIAAGSFSSSLTIGGSTYAGSALRDSLIVELSLAGGVRGVRTFMASDDDEAVDVVVGLADSTVVLGQWYGSITLGSATYLSRNRTTGGPSQDVYVTRFSSL